MDIVNAIGITAGVLTTASFIPQVLKIWETKSSKDISLGMFFVLGIGICLWIIYGIMANALPVILANSVTILLIIIIITLKLKYK